MREESIIGGFQDLNQKLGQVIKFVEQMQQSVRLAFTGSEIRGNALQKLMLKKGLITEAELTEQIGETIKEMQQQAEEAAKKAEIVVPSTQQVQQVTATPADAPVVPPVQA